MKTYFEEVHSEIKKHALEEYPNECCGVIVQGRTELIYHKCKNVAENKKEHFTISAMDLIVAENRGDIKAIVHSHDNYFHASKHDMEEQLRFGIPFGIVFIKNGQIQDINFWGDTLPIQTYTKRPFRHGIYDCYALVRDYHRGELGVNPKEIVREYKWWLKDKNLLYDSLTEAGFVVLEKRLKDLEVGDCILAHVISKFVNHCGVYIGNGLLLHHLCLHNNSLSRVEPINSINPKHISHIVRNKELM